MAKFKKIKENKEKKSFIYRIQDADKPLYLKYLPEFESFYLSIPKEAALEINSHVSELIGKGSHFAINISDDYDNASTGVTCYDEVEKKIMISMRGHSCRLSDVVLSIKESKLKGKLSKVITECRISDKKMSYMIGDDYFDDLGPDESAGHIVDDDAMPMPTNEAPLSEAELIVDSGVIGGDLPF